MVLARRKCAECVGHDARSDRLMWACRRAPEETDAARTLAGSVQTSCRYYTRSAYVPPTRLSAIFATLIERRTD